MAPFVDLIVSAASSNTGYGLNLTFGTNDRCRSGEGHAFWFHWIEDPDGPWLINQCVGCGQNADTGRIEWDEFFGGDGRITGEKRPVSLDDPFRALIETSRNLLGVIQGDSVHRNSQELQDFARALEAAKRLYAEGSSA